MLSQANAASIEKALLPLSQRFREQIERQEALVQRFQYLSPAIMMQSALNEISGTSTGRYQDFLDQATCFRYAIERLVRRALPESVSRCGPRTTTASRVFS